MSTLGLPVLILVFLLAAAAVWVAGIKVSETTAVLSQRLGWGTAIGGLVALAVVTNLPETAIVLSGAARGDMSLAVGNILGGIAAQTVVLALLDLFGPRGRGPLTYRSTDLSLMLEGLLVVAILGLVLAGTQMPSSVILLRLTPVPVLIAVTWFVGVRLIAQRGDSLPWKPTDAPRPVSTVPTGAGAVRPGAAARSTARTAVIFTVGALVTLIAGVALEQSSDAIASDLGMSGAVFGATVLAAATSLPELSTGLTSVRQNHDAMAISDIFGGNAFLPVLFLPAVVITGQAVLPHAGATNVFLTASGIVLTVVYLTGLILRPRRRVAGMGVDSLLVLLLYAATIAGVALL